MIKQYKKKMGRFFDTLKSAFIEEVPEKNDTVLVSERKSERKKEEVHEFKYNTTNSAAIDDDLFKYLCSVIESNNDESPNYFDLKTAVNDESLKKNIQDENLRFTCAFISMKAGNPNFTKDKILKNIDKCISLLENERAVGYSELEECKKSFLEKEDLVKVKNEEIKRLQDKINELEKEVVSIQKDVNESEKLINEKKEKFDSTINYLKANLESDKTKITNILN